MGQNAMAQVLIRNLKASGYKIDDINQLLLIFKKNLSEVQDVLSHSENITIIRTLHKLKGGLKILQLSEKLTEFESLENKIHTDGVTTNLKEISKFVEQCNEIIKLGLIAINNSYHGND